MAARETLNHLIISIWEAAVHVGITYQAAWIIAVTAGTTIHLNLEESIVKNAMLIAGLSLFP